MRPSVAPALSHLMHSVVQGVMSSMLGMTFFSLVRKVSSPRANSNHHPQRRTGSVGNPLAADWGMRLSKHALIRPMGAVQTVIMNSSPY